MTIKRTHRMIMALEVMNSSPRFSGLELDPESTTNAMVTDLMHSAGYSWDKRKQTWAISARREKSMKELANSAVKRSTGHETIQIRLMGPMGQLKGIAEDFKEVADLIGLNVLNTSNAKPLRQGGTWGRIYITAEVR